MGRAVLVSVDVLEMRMDPEPGPLGPIACGDAPVMSNVAVPCAIRVWEQHKACDGWLSLFEVAIQQVDGEATAGIERILHCPKVRARRVAEGCLPEAGLTRGDVEVALL